jgi:antitoxin (DNA-binding transcriptional repressor) of toxin-antitoxin stability system
MASLPKQTPKDTERVGIREFRQNIAKYLLESDAPIVLTRHGDEVGYFTPLRHKRLTDEELRAWDEHAERVQKMLAEKGLDGEQIVEEYERERTAQRKRYGSKRTSTS